ncbi:Unannotated [Lentimonas sp. CC19]|nr:Unannotated [Lentimonas sp. CC19]
MHQRPFVSYWAQSFSYVCRGLIPRGELVARAQKYRNDETITYNDSSDVLRCPVFLSSRKPTQYCLPDDG